MSNNGKKKMDPRIKRTTRMFKDALISLIQENYDKSNLTVRIIADRAELNRATFYLHYQDIDDLIQQMIDEVLDELYNTLKPPSEDNPSNEKGYPSPRDQLISFLDHFYRNRGLYNVMLENKDFRKRVFDILLDIVIFWAEDRKMKGRSFQVSNETIAASTLGILSWWLQEGTPYSPSYLAQQISLMYK
ncbi:TetR/AcrR family transcriptional regulator [Heyndrickxia sp. NPDC080065]|uniref:TetR/AcrR family transcriptional regulator n=1 Tax=Heyndrickxia sp. NPDC080065 TaxID=3390568 RepID=UPI003CFEF659